MKVKLECQLEGKTNMDVTAEVTTFADLSKLGKKLQDTVAGVKKVLPDMAQKTVEKLRIATE